MAFLPLNDMHGLQKDYLKYAYDPFEAGYLANSRNVNTRGSIPMKWVVAWELDDDRGMWCRDIERENEERYWEFADRYGEDWALKEMNEERIFRVVREKLREEKLRGY